MPKKIKVVDVNTETPVEQVPNVTVVAVTPEETTVTVEVPPPTVTEPVEVEPTEPVVMKKRGTRTTKPKPKKELQPIVEEATKVEETQKVEEAPKVEEPINKIEVLEELPKKNVKTVELVECPKCGKKVTERTLKYSHQSVCPANNPPDAQPKEQRKKQKQKQEDKQDDGVIYIQQEREPEPPVGVVRRITRRSERYRHLIANAF